MRRPHSPSPSYLLIRFSLSLRYRSEADKEIFFSLAKGFKGFGEEVCLVMSEQLTEQQAISLITTVGAGFALWLRDLFRFNRASLNVTRVQWAALWIKLLWAFSYWCTGLQIKRGSYIAFVSPLLSFSLWFVSTTSVLNESFFLTRQQFISFGIGIGIEYLFVTSSFLQYS